MRRYDNKAFTILELLVAMGLLVAMLAISGMVFKMAVDAYRRAEATGEVTRKLRAIVNQLDADFRGLNFQGEVVMVWAPSPLLDSQGQIVDVNKDTIPDRYERFDRVMLFANGNFQSYSPQPPSPNPIPAATVPALVAGAAQKLVQGNMARVCYMLANDNNQDSPINQPHKTRILARSQHILTSDRELIGDPDPTTGLFLYPLNPNDIKATFGDPYLHKFEYENLSVQQWLDMAPADKEIALTRLLNVRVGSVTPQEVLPTDGLTADSDPVANPHIFLGEGVGSFAVQGWLDSEQRWFPEVDRNQDGDYLDTDFNLNGNMIDTVNLKGVVWNPQMAAFETELRTGGIGRALKFTFTLYDSHGVFKNGKTFTHIVYLK